MSCFVIIHCPEKEISDWILKSKTAFRKLYPEHKEIEPQIFKGCWGVGLFWKGRSDLLSSFHHKTGEILNLNLGYNPHTKLNPALNLDSRPDTLNSTRESPLEEPEKSLGIYCLIRSSISRLVCIPDPFSFYPIYIIRNGLPKIICNNQLLAISLEGQTPEIDKEAIWERLLTEGNLGNRCIFKNIRRIDATEWLYLDSEGIQILRYDFKDTKISQEEFANILKDNFRNLAASELPFFLKLTGGRDSRLNLGACLSAGISPVCFTLKSVDSEPASELARFFNLKHIEAEMDGRIISNDPELKKLHQQMIPNALCVTGGCGELARAFYMKNPLPKESVWDCVERNYFSVKRKGLLQDSKIRIVRNFLSKKWSSIQYFDSITKCENADSLYVDRIRTWYAEAWASPAGSPNVPFLVGPAMNSFGKSFSLKEKSECVPHDLLISGFLGNGLPPILKLKDSVFRKFTMLLPEKLQVHLYKIQYQLICILKRRNNVDEADKMLFKGILNLRELIFIRMIQPKEYYGVRDLLRRVSFIQ